MDRALVVVLVKDAVLEGDSGLVLAGTGVTGEVLIRVALTLLQEDGMRALMP
jgi:hypothetical protein